MLVRCCRPNRSPIHTLTSYDAARRRWNQPVRRGRIGRCLFPPVAGFPIAGALPVVLRSTVPENGVECRESRGFPADELAWRTPF